jgi:hypothetical protein
VFHACPAAVAEVLFRRHALRPNGSLNRSHERTRAVGVGDDVSSSPISEQIAKE